MATPFQKEVDPQEVAIAYGRRQVEKLVGVLKLGNELPPEKCKQALQALLDCTSSQVRKPKGCIGDTDLSMAKILHDMHKYFNNCCNTR
jgi:hypothetical protein